MDDLAGRIEGEGPLANRDAVRLVARLARAVESMHAAGRVHGRIGARAIALPGARLAQARLIPAADCREDEAFHSPERMRGSGATQADDAFAVALTLYYALTAWMPPRSPSDTARPPPLAVFDAGDDVLEDLLDAALAPEPSARPRDLASFRRDLDRWLEREGAAVDDGLPLLEGPTSEEPAVDLSSLPPPPAPEGGTAPKRGRDESPLYARDDEESTWRKTEHRPRSARPPRLVPPSLPRASAAKTRSGPPPLPAPLADDEADAGRPTLPKARPPNAPAGEARAARARERVGPALGWRTTLVVIAAVGAVVVGGYFAVSSLTAPAVTAPSASVGAGSIATTSTKAATEAPIAPASATASSSAIVSSDPTSSASAPARPPDAPPLDPDACLRGLFPEDTFENGEPKLDFVCTEAKPVSGAPRVRERTVVTGGGKVTGGMKEWAVLGFYELAAYAALRGRCCPSAPPMDLPAAPGSCRELREPLEGVAAVARPGSTDEEVARAIESFDKAVRCITRSKQTLAFGGHPRPSGGEGTTLKKILARARANP